MINPGRGTMLAYLDAMSSNADLLKLCSILRNGLRNDAETCEILEKFRPSGNELAPIPVAEIEVIKPERKNINPGLPMIGKIGTETKKHILDLIAANRHPGPKYVEHLKLLWARNEVKWDGKDYYL